MPLDLCSQNLPNAGAPNCDKSRGIPRFLIIGDASFDSTAYASQVAFKAAFKSACLTARGTTGKLIVLPIIADVENKTGDNTTGSLNQGFTEVLREGFPAFDYGVQISNRHAQILRPLNGQDLKVFTVDHNLNIWGTYTSDAKFRGESAKIFVGGDNFTDGQSSKTVKINVSYTDVEEFKASSRYFTIDFAASDYGRLKDVQLYEKAAAASNVFKISGKISTGKVGYYLDIYLDYSAVIANIARWVATNKATGAAFTITSVAVNAAGYWTVTLDSTAWTALTTGDIVVLNFAGPSVLDAAGATGIEGLSIELVKP